MNQLIKYKINTSKWLLNLPDRKLGNYSEILEVIGTSLSRQESSSHSEGQKGTANKWWCPGTPSPIWRWLCTVDSDRVCRKDGLWHRMGHWEIGCYYLQRVRNSDRRHSTCHWLQISRTATNQPGVSHRCLTLGYPYSPYSPGFLNPVCILPRAPKVPLGTWPAEFLFLPQSLCSFSIWWIYRERRWARLPDGLFSFSTSRQVCRTQMARIRQPENIHVCTCSLLTSELGWIPMITKLLYKTDVENAELLVKSMFAWQPVKDGCSPGEAVCEQVHL